MQLHRKILQPAFSKAQVRQYQDNQERQALICLRNMLDDQANYIRAIRRFAVAIVLGISYGIDVESPDSPWIKIADDAAEAISNSGAPASSIIDHFPASMFNFHLSITISLIISIARHLPTWLPFMERLRYARKWKWAIEAITNIPFTVAQKEMVD